ncbi:transglutaminase-like cysteine peptidase [Aestuariivirga sp.]|uniref:transglutaminase-like cysteine peptidase n=1 Tax=Aestuariivirga sp. TaxID=2650926 RepID=UPI003919566E
MGRVGKGVAAILGCMLALFAGLPADAAAAKSSSAREYGDTLPPIGFVEFCQRNPEDCQASGKRRKLAMTEEKWLLVRMVNAFVNGAIAPVTDETLYGTPEYWTLPADAGDCEDLVLMKKKILQSKGLPADALRITVVLDEHGEGHAVLTLVTSGGDFILDNRRNEIRSAAATGYTLLKRQSAADPRKWVSLAPARTLSAVNGTASK